MSDAFPYSLVLLMGFGWALSQTERQLDTQEKRIGQLEEELARLRPAVTDHTNADTRIRLS